MKIAQITLVLFFCYQLLLAQKIKPEDKQYAEGIAKQYPKASFAFTSDIINVTFSKSSAADMNRKECSVAQVEETHEVEIISLKELNTNYTEPIYVNEFISVSDFDMDSKTFYHINTVNYFGEGIFYNDAKIKTYKIDFYEAAEKAKYNFSVQYGDIKYFNSLYFTQPEPCFKKQIIIEIPTWLEVEVIEMNFDGYQIEKAVTEGLNGESIYTYTATNLPAMVHEDNAPHQASVYPHLYFCIKSFQGKESTVEMFGTLSGLYKWYHELVLSTGNDLTEIKPMVNNLLKDKTNDMDKIETLFYWVQDNIRYIAFENGIMGFKPESVQNVFKNGYGDCKGQANLLCEMLKIAGFDARMVWLGTKGIPYNYEHPSIAVDNHAICAVIMNNETIFLDPTESKIAMNDYADRIQGRSVLIENGDQYIVSTIPTFSHERNLGTTDIHLTVNSTFDQLTGTQHQVINGESKVSFLSSYEQVSNPNKDEALNNYMRNGNKNVSVSAVELSDLSNRNEPINITSNISFKNQITMLGNELYILLENDKILYGTEFDSSRVNDYIFPFKINFKSSTVLDIPTGYSVDYLPTDFNAEVSGFHFNLQYRQVGQTIVYDKAIYSTSTWLKKTDYPQWNKTIKSLTKYYKEQITLKK